MFTPATRVSINGEDWLINGEPTHPGREFRGWRIEGLLLNSRMANGVFDDDNPLTRDLWAYPDTGEWDAERNVSELVAAMPSYRSHGLMGIALNLQGASPLGYYRTDGMDQLMERIRRTHPDATQEQVWAGVPGVESQPWISGCFEPDGALKPAFIGRATRVIEAADALGMVVILGLFYFGQDERLQDEEAVRRAVEQACGWVLDSGYTNVVIEINNECDVPKYEHEILTPPRVHELIEQARGITDGGRRLLVSTSFTRRQVPTEAVCAASDFILLHGNGMHDPAEIEKRVDDTRAVPTYRPMPVLFNEDDHFDFDKPRNNFTAALSKRAGWGYFDPGPGAGGGAAYGDYVEGYQNPPVNWDINTPRKKAFFEFLSEVTGELP
ncbi:MAG: hypothetical protein WD208_00035 [Dehalococcoidia bacterium]